MYKIFTDMESVTIGHNNFVGLHYHGTSVCFITLGLLFVTNDSYIVCYNIFIVFI